MHLEFCVSLCREQLKNGRYVLHEHPAHASSWQTDIMEKFMREPGVVRVTCDQCVYGCRPWRGRPASSPTHLSSAGSSARDAVAVGACVADPRAACTRNVVARLLVLRPCTTSSCVELSSSGSGAS